MNARLKLGAGGGLWLLLALSCVAPVPSGRQEPAETGPGEVSFEYAGAGEAAVVVDARINERGPFKLVVDTGATLTCVDPDLAAELGLPRERGVRGLGAGIHGAGQVGLVSIASLEVGSARASDLTACTIDLRQLESVAPGIRGLLGLNFLRSYRVVFDFERQTLRLEDPSDGSPTPRPS